ncbi:MAG TPA: vitamin K epoxide reductase family protein [Acidimicrobiales bacterium]|nr:vitamin K epoxide reductase family protein [Acidimicrobiales bacterium]
MPRGAPTTGDDGEAERPPRSWRPVVTTLVSFLGLGVSVYLTIEHFNGGSPVCPTNGLSNCLKVTTSAESYVFGIPVAVLGLAFFLPMLALSIPWAWRSANPLVAPARLAMAVVGIGFVFYLVYSELFTIHAICLWCTGVHVLTFVLFVAVVTGWEQATASRRDHLEAA